MLIWIIATRTFLHNIYDFRFLIALPLVIVVVGVSAFLSISQMADKQRAYAQLRHVASESASLESVKLVRRPASLSFLYEGSEDELPRYLITTADFVDFPIEEISTQAIVEPFVRLDWVFIVLYFYSLLAILLTFDLISGQRELRTLPLVLAQSVSRGTLLLGSYLGTLLTLLPTLLIGYLIFLLAASISGLWTINGDDGIRLLLIFLLSFLFVSSIALLGILASASFEKSSASLTAAFLVWAMITVVVPGIGKLAVHLLVPVPSFKDLQTRIGTARAEYRAKLPAVWSMDIARIVRRPGLTLQQREQALDKYQAEILKADTEAITWYKGNLRRLRAEYLASHRHRSELVRRLELLSPSSTYQHAVEAVVGTGQPHLAAFIRAAENYMEVYTRYSAQKREELKNQAQLSGFSIEESGYRVRSVSWIDYSGVEFDRSSMPGFEDPGVSIPQGLNFALVDSSLLAFLNIILFMLAYRAILSCRVT
jgi:ABC-type transport system involved in multi-copper enzyme maturation permease subunit